MSGAHTSAVPLYWRHQVGRVGKAELSRLKWTRSVEVRSWRPSPVEYSRYWPDGVRSMVGSWTTTSPVTWPGPG